MSAQVTIGEIAEALGRTKSVVLRRAKREGWTHSTRPARGGQVFLYDLDTLPRKVSRRVAAKRAIVAVKAVSVKTEKPAPDVFVMVFGDEVFEVRRVGK